MKHSVRFPGESEAYRSAREQLLDDEIALRRNIEAVAAKRRQLPLGGEVPQDYVFDEEQGQVRMSQLFSPGKDTLVIYSYMFGPQMAKPCPFCTSILDGLDGEAPHIVQRVNFAVAAKSPIALIREFARGRMAQSAASFIRKQQLQPRLSRRGAKRRSDAGAECLRAPQWPHPSFLQH
jgi:predicted dithiol-disulfide oxidoreductase (DUF899 family)